MYTCNKQSIIRLFFAACALIVSKRFSLSTECIMLTKGAMYFNFVALQMSYKMPLNIGSVIVSFLKPVPAHNSHQKSVAHRHAFSISLLGLVFDTTWCWTIRFQFLSYRLNNGTIVFHENKYVFKMISFVRQQLFFVPLPTKTAIVISMDKRKPGNGLVQFDITVCYSVYYNIIHFNLFVLRGPENYFRLTAAKISLTIAFAVDCFFAAHQILQGKSNAMSLVCELIHQHHCSVMIAKLIFCIY